MPILNKIQTVSDARKYAESFISEGVGYIAHGLNACDSSNIPYRYSKADIEKLESLVMQLIDIVNNGKVELLAGKRAKADLKFQAFLKKSFQRQ